MSNQDENEAKLKVEWQFQFPKARMLFFDNCELDFDSIQLFFVITAFPTTFLRFVEIIYSLRLEGNYENSDIC